MICSQDLRDYTRIAIQTSDMTVTPYAHPEYGFAFYISGTGFFHNGNKSQPHDMKTLIYYELIDKHNRKWSLDDLSKVFNCKEYNLTTLSKMPEVFCVPDGGYIRTFLTTNSWASDKAPHMMSVSKETILSRKHLSETQLKRCCTFDDYSFVIPTASSEYMFDTELAKILSGDDIVVRSLLMDTSDPYHPTLNYTQGELFAHVVYCKREKDVKAVHRHFRKKYPELSTTIVYREASNHPLVRAYRMVRSVIAPDRIVYIDGIRNKKMKYGFVVDVSQARRLGYAERIEDAISSSKNFWVDGNISIRNAKSKSVNLYTVNDKCLSYMKLASWWKDVISEVYINSESLIK